MKNEKELLIKKILLFTGCMLISILIYSAICIVFTPKSADDSGGTIYYGGMGFHAEPENSLDIVVYGNSDVYSGFAPAVLFEHYGYTSYASGRANQTVKGTIALLNQTFSNQKPKLVILETDCFYAKRNHLPGSSSIVVAPFIYHSRWKELNLKDFTRLPKRADTPDISKGFVPSKIVKKAEFKSSYMGRKNNEPKAIPEKNALAITDFISTCRKHGAEVIFVTLPSPSSWNYKKHNAVAAFAKEHKVPFVDLNAEESGYKTDMDMDFRDNGNHLNVIGAEKATRFLGEYISINYGNLFKDKRKDRVYTKWHDTVRSFRDMKPESV